MADVESKSIPHELPSSHWLKATGQCVLERYLSATMGLLQLYFPLSREKKNGWAGNCFGSARSSFVTLLSALCAFSQGSNLGFHVARLYLPISTVRLSVCLSVDSALFGKHCCTRRKNYKLLILYPGSVLRHSSPILKHIDQTTRIAL